MSETHPYKLNEPADKQGTAVCSQGQQSIVEVSDHG